MKSNAKKEVYEFQWLEPKKGKGDKITYEPTIDFFTEYQAKKKGFVHCLKDTKRLRLNLPPLLKDLENLIHLCKITLPKFEHEIENPPQGNREKPVEGRYDFSDIVEPYIFKMFDKYKMQYTNREYAIYFKKREEAKVKPPNDVLNKDNKAASLWWQIRSSSMLVVYSKYILNKKVDEWGLSTYDKLQAFVKVLEDYKKTFFSTTQEQRDRILALDAKATFPENEMVNTKLDYYDLEAALLNKKNELRGPWYYPSLEEKKKKESIVISPDELAFMHAHHHSMCMIRYKGLYYGYYASGYAMDRRNTKEDNDKIHCDMGLTRAQTVKQIQIKQRIGQSFVKDCFPKMDDEQIQKYCMDRLEKLDTTNFTNNYDYDFKEAIEFCQKHGLDEAVKHIVKNFPDREVVKKAFEKRTRLPLYQYAIDGNLDMIKFFYEEGADFSEHSYALLEYAATANNLEVLKYLFSKFEKQLTWNEVGKEFIERVFDQGYNEILNFLAQKGYFCYAVENSKTDNTRYYDKETAEMLAKHKAIRVKIQKDKKAKRAAEEKAWKEKEAAQEKIRKQNLIEKLGSSNKAVQNKIKKLPSRELRELEHILSTPKKAYKKKEKAVLQTQEVAVLEKKAPEPEKKVIIPDWFILGKMYRVKSKEWFNENKGEKWWVEQDGVKFHDSDLCGKSFMLVDFCETLHGHHNDVEMHDPTNTKDKWNYKYIPMFVLEPDPGDHRNLSEEILKLEKEVKAHKFIYSARNATGAGRGRLRETDKVTIRAGYDRKGNECLQLPGGDTFSRILWPIEKIRQLVKGEKITHSFSITEHSGACDEVVIGNDKKKIPGDFQWESYGFG